MMNKKIGIDCQAGTEADSTTKDGVNSSSPNFAKGVLGANVPNYRDVKVMIGLSAGINSMAVLVWLSKYEFKPKELHLFYAHFKEHSPGSLDFVLAGVEYAKKHFETVIYKQTDNSVIDFFREQKMIPHPTAAPCTKMLKIEPMVTYAFENGVTVDLVGYIRSEKRRVKNMQSKGADNLFMSKQFPILQEDNEWCFSVVKEAIGFYPTIYDIRNKKGKRMFTHNNCLPCKNMQMDDFNEVKEYYPEYWQSAMDLSIELQKYWGRSEGDFYTTFGRPDLGLEKQPCEVCAMD